MKFAGKKILVVSPDFPYPPNHGGRVDIWGRIQTLSRLGFAIDLVATVKSDPEPEETDAVKQFVRNVICLKRSTSFSDCLSVLPLQVTSRNCLKTVELSGGYDFALLEGEYVYSVLANPTLRAAHRVLRVHNNEAVYFRQLARSSESWWRRLYYSLESLKFKRMDPLVRQNLDGLLYVSQDEYAAAKKKRSHADCIFLPTHIRTDEFRRQELGTRTVLFIGSLFMPNIQHAVRWYIEKVHPKLLDVEGYELVIAGNSNGQRMDWLYALADRNGKIRVFDSPKDLEPYYEQSSVFVNLMLNGAGLIQKGIRAIQNGMPVVSTTIGNQGSGLIHGKHLLVADDPEEFARHVKHLLSDPKMARNMVDTAQAWLAEHYDQEAILGDYFLSLLEENKKEVHHASEGRKCC